LGSVATVALASTSSTPVTIGYELGGDSALAATLHNKYFQQDLGSNVSLKVFESGPAALSSIASGSINFMCAIGIPPVVSALTQGVPLQLIYSEDRYTTSAGFVATKASGITTIAGLKGKKIGLVTGSQSQFELSEFLARGGLTLSDVTTVNLTPPELQAAWSTGAVDAGVTWSPVLNTLEKTGTLLGTDASLPATADSYNICVTNKTWAAAHPTAVDAFLKALNSGNVFANAHVVTAEQYNASLGGMSLGIAKDLTNGLISPTLAQQLTPAVLGASASSVNTSGVAQSLRNNWETLYKSGFITVAPPASVSKYIDWSGVSAAYKALK
jgi:ABC-type nitrate/sulfonate/bicarbonate transport system substrate-binding protein